MVAHADGDEESLEGGYLPHRVESNNLLDGLLAFDFGDSVGDGAENDVIEFPFFSSARLQEDVLQLLIIFECYNEGVSQAGSLLLELCFIEVVGESGGRSFFEATITECMRAESILFVELIVLHVNPL